MTHSAQVEVASERARQPQLTGRPGYGKLVEEIRKWAAAAGLVSRSGPRTGWGFSFPVPNSNVLQGRHLDRADVLLTLRERRAMPIYRLFQHYPFSQEEIERLVSAYEDTLRALGLTDRSDPLTQLVAKKIIEVAQTGVRDPAEISERALKGLSRWLRE